MLVAVALLFAQWTGFNHGIAHAHLQQLQAVVFAMADIGNDDIYDQSPAQHSCAAYEAATVGDTIQAIPFINPLIICVRLLDTWAAFISWDAPLTSYFSSRAPPLA